jgi:hypothetical protein
MPLWVVLQLGHIVNRVWNVLVPWASNNAKLLTHATGATDTVKA